jgi:OmpA-OmpF porin, OOP family
MRRRAIVGGGAIALTFLALVCIPRHLSSSASTPPLVPANFHARLDQHELTLRGSLPDIETRERILHHAHSLYDQAEVRIVDELTVDGRISPETWLTSLPSILPALGQMDGRGSIMIDGRSLVLSGQVHTAQDKETILRNVSALTATGLDLEDLILAVPSPTPRPSLQAKLNEVLSRHQIEFESNKATLTPRGLSALNQLILLLQKAPQTSIEIAGHTDKFGAPDYNRDLSRRRAETVRKYFIAHGLTHHFTIVGYGATKPLTTETTRIALRRNRRIELRVHEKGSL